MSAKRIVGNPTWYPGPLILVGLLVILNAGGLFIVVLLLRVLTGGS